MAIYTVGGAFNFYRAQNVDLLRSDVLRARASRDFLIEQIFKIAAVKRAFPSLFDNHMFYGSFARRTKIHPLDDIDLLLAINSTEIEIFTIAPYKYAIRPKLSNHHLMDYVNTSGYISSLSIQNRLRDQLSDVPQYEQATIKKNNVAVVLKLKSYPWAFDIVPAFPIYNWLNILDYYLIPDGKGYWIRTDPRKDQVLITRVNQWQNELLLPIVRLIKYWNRIHTPSINSSYYLETLAIRALEFESPVVSIADGLAKVFTSLEHSLLGTCPDPKQLGENLELSTDWNTRYIVSKSVHRMSVLAHTARYHEVSGNHKTAISFWTQIFPNFPAYG